MKAVKFEIIAKLGPKEITRTWGLERSPEHLTVADMTEVIELEQKLEKLTGLRWHINPHQM